MWGVAGGAPGGTFLRGSAGRRVHHWSVHRCRQDGRLPSPLSPLDDIVSLLSCCFKIKPSVQTFLLRSLLLHLSCHHFNLKTGWPDVMISWKYQYPWHFFISDPFALFISLFQSHCYFAESSNDWEMFFLRVASLMRSSDSSWRDAFSRSLWKLTAESRNSQIRRSKAKQISWKHPGALSLSVCADIIQHFLKSCDGVWHIMLNGARPKINQNQKPWFERVLLKGQIVNQNASYWFSFE